MPVLPQFPSPFIHAIRKISLLDFFLLEGMPFFILLSTLLGLSVLVVFASELAVRRRGRHLFRRADWLCDRLSEMAFVLGIAGALHKVVWVLLNMVESCIVVFTPDSVFQCFVPPFVAGIGACMVRALGLLAVLVLNRGSSPDGHEQKRSAVLSHGQPVESFKDTSESKVA